jgi:hypothetical protein
MSPLVWCRPWNKGSCLRANKRSWFPRTSWFTSVFKAAAWRLHLLYYAHLVTSGCFTGWLQMEVESIVLLSGRDVGYLPWWYGIGMTIKYARGSKAVPYDYWTTDWLIHWVCYCQWISTGLPEDSIYLSSCCSHLEHRASVKRSFHFSFLILDSR